ncbi:Octanoyltransferase [Streptococcus pneumoniae]|nr:Octanoyltransferase [Streptococcus pneumoniae]
MRHLGGGGLSQRDRLGPGRRVYGGGGLFRTRPRRRVRGERRIEQQRELGGRFGDQDGQRRPMPGGARRPTGERVPAQGGPRMDVTRRPHRRRRPRFRPGPLHRGERLGGREARRRPGPRRPADHAGDAEVGEGRAAVDAEQDVRRGHVAVHHPLAVKARESLRDRDEHGDGLPRAQGSDPLHHVLQRAGRAVLGEDPEAPVRLHHAEHAQQMGMRDPSGLRLRRQGVRRRAGAGHLQGGPDAPAVLDEPDLRLGARAEQPDGCPARGARRSRARLRRPLRFRLRPAADASGRAAVRLVPVPHPAPLSATPSVPSQGAACPRASRRLSTGPGPRTTVDVMPETLLPPLRVLGLAPDLVDYHAAWDAQRALHADVVAGRSDGEFLLLEHEAVYTAGRRTEDAERPTDGAPVVDVDRGGKITWHGPGQLVGYPVVRLRDRAHVKDYVWFLEELLIRTAAEFGVTAVRVDGRAGIWVLADRDDDGTARPDRKVGAIGLSIHDGVSMHGFALNCSNSLAPYEGIIACGITDAATTTLSVETGRTITPADVVPVLTRHLDELGPAFIAVTPTEGIPA